MSLLFHEQNESVQLGQKPEYVKISKFNSAYSIGTQTQFKRGEEACMKGKYREGAVYVAVL